MINSYTHHRITCLLSLRNVGPSILHGCVFPSELVELILKLISIPQFFDTARLFLSKNPAVLSEDNSLAVWTPPTGYCYQSCFSKVAVPLDVGLGPRDFYEFTILFEANNQSATFSSYGNIGWVAIGFAEESKMYSAITHMTLGHGFYCLSNNGHSWKSDRSPSNLLNGFSWAHGDIVSCVYDGKIQTITMRKFSNKNIQEDKEEVCIIENVPNQGELLVPVVLLHSAHSSAKILKAEEHDDWYKLTKQREVQKKIEQARKAEELKKENEIKINELVGMGFDRDSAETALKVNNGELENSVDWLIQGKHLSADEETEEDIDQTQQEEVQTEVYTTDESKITQLIEMGFDRDVALDALRKSNNNVERAITSLFQ
jgi:Holliday junction resolvasome RuvABC DNA-binding subunit